MKHLRMLLLEMVLLTSLRILDRCCFFVGKRRVAGSEIIRSLVGSDCNFGCKHKLVGSDRSLRCTHKLVGPDCNLNLECSYHIIEVFGMGLVILIATLPC